MRAFIVFSCLALAAAKPQYSYNQPSGLLGSSSNLQGIGLGGPSLLSSSSNQNLGLAAPGLLQSYQPAPITTTTVQKHIYVHVPPQEQEEPIHAPAPIVNHQKHYKIIFIKAPSGPSISQQLLQSQQTQSISEEKTLVYVLVKKPESVSDIRIPQPVAPQPSKPEVYFIKYKTEKDNGAPNGLSAPIGLSAPSSSSNVPVLLSAQGPSNSFSGPSPASIALPSSSSGVSDNSLLGLGSSQPSSIIQPRNPSPVYGPAN